ncbi:MAG: putative sugar nucleotidyl transferase [Chitinophagaceae bacterium]
MNKIIFTEEFCQPEKLYPFTLTRQIQDIRVGIMTIREKWEKMLGLVSFDKKEDDYKDLEESVNIDDVIGNGFCFIVHGNVLPTPELVKAVLRLRNGEFLATDNNNNIVYRISKNEIIDKFKIKVGRAVTYKGEVKTIQYPWDIIKLNDWAIRQDFKVLKGKRNSQKIPKSNKVINSSQVFLEKGVKMEHCIINASTGPIYIGKNALLREGSCIRGPFAMGTGACLKMGTKVYGATTLGPGCIAGGEIKNTVLFGNSNKAHDGYLGDSVIGEWCNLGAGTTNSNIKNNASDVKVWTQGGEINAGKKCGIMMGDYSRSAINTSFNTGTVIGVSCNILGSGLTSKYIPNFSWGSEGIKRYRLEKALSDIGEWKALKGQVLKEDERKILKYIYAKVSG